VAVEAAAAPSPALPVTWVAAKGAGIVLRKVWSRFLGGLNGGMVVRNA
jgi:hypothetical protein